MSAASSVFYYLTGPAGDAANEIVDVIAVSAVFDQRVAIAFVGEGVKQLFDRTTDSDAKNTTEFLSSLLSYDVEEFLVARESLTDLELMSEFEELHNRDPSSFIGHVEPHDINDIRARMREFDMVVTD